MIEQVIGFMSTIRNQVSRLENPESDQKIKFDTQNAAIFNIDAVQKSLDDMRFLNTPLNKIVK
jgi:hypothetical protein